jgi:hypothetical protein
MIVLRLQSIQMVLIEPLIFGARQVLAFFLSAEDQVVFSPDKLTKVLYFRFGCPR